MDELLLLAEQNDGLVTASQARALGIQDSVLARLAQRGKLGRVARGVYRIPHFPADLLSQYREAILWVRASHGPERVVLSHETALGVYAISDVNPYHRPARRKTPAPETEMDHDSSLRPGAERR